MTLDEATLAAEARRLITLIKAGKYTQAHLYVRTHEQEMLDIAKRISPKALKLTQEALKETWAAINDDIARRVRRPKFGV